MTGENDQNDSVGLSNEALGLILAALVLAWFLIGITYAALVNYSG